MKTVDYINHTFLIRFDGADFKSALSLVKALPGSAFIPSERIWTISPSNKVIKELKDNAFTFTADASQYIDSLSSPEAKRFISNTKKEHMKVILKGLDNYQIKAVEFLEQNDGIGLLADEMGLGKTVEAIGYIKLHTDLRPALIFCPATAKLVWKAHIDDWLGEPSEVLYGEKSFSLTKQNITIINYDILGSLKAKLNRYQKDIWEEYSWINELMKIDYKVIIMDEVQYISSGKAIRAKASVLVKRKFNKASFIPISGTPILSYPKEFFTVLNLLNPYMFPNRMKYYFRYCDPKHNGFGFTYNGTSNIDELHEKISTLMIRRLKADVLKELPEKRRIIVPLELDKIAESEYKEADNEFIEWLKSNLKSGIDARIEIEKLKQLAYIGKRNYLIKWIEDYIRIEGKLVVFTYHKKAMADLYNHFGKIAVKIDGSTSAIDRKKAENDFQNKDNIKLFIGQIKAAGTVITLTAAKAVAFAELGWTSGEHIQAEDRVHRRGQKADSVFAYYLIGNNTVEATIADLIRDKYKIIKRVLDGTKKESFFTHNDNNVLSTILKVYREKSK